ncbi:MAG TPA: ABC transporter ATP-binding protein [Gaiellales bacterium]|nr:ABC transporter ATP-binding protein [Gaiellales bacterium]
MDVEGLTIDVRNRNKHASVVRGVSLSVGVGEALGIVGESGSGKSLTLRALLGVLPKGTEVASGSICYRGDMLVKDGCETDKMRSLRGREIGMVFQDATSALDPVIRVGDQITESLRRHTGVRRRAATVRTIELMGRMGIPDARRRVRQYPHEFSGGMRQRVMIAMAIACNPSLLLCDEPTTALDVTTQTEILELLAELRQEQGLAMIFVSHDLGVIAEVCERVCVMYCGEIVEAGARAEVFAAPRHPYTLGLIESAPDIEAPSPALVAIPGEAPDPTAPPAGCRFNPRCPMPLEDCRSGGFPLIPLPGERATACIRHERTGSLRHRRGPEASSG